jgi:hypothetical protein
MNKLVVFVFKGIALKVIDKNNALFLADQFTESKLPCTAGGQPKHLFD